MAVLYLLSLALKGVIFLAFLRKICRQVRCSIMGRLCFLIALCSLFQLYKRVLPAFVMDCVSCLKLLLTKFSDFGCGFLIFGCFSKLCNVVVVFFTFLLGFKVLQFSGHYKFRKGLSLMCSHGVEIDGVKNLVPFKHGTTRISRVSGNHGCSGDQKLEEFDDFVSSNRGFQKEKDDCFLGNEGQENSEENIDVDQVFDVMSLRKMVKAERRRANAIRCELEKERMAAASAADEAMAMILRLQNEKSTLQMQVNQLHRLAEEKKQYDQEVIQNLQWIIMKHESERSLLEDQLRVCREKLRLYVKSEEWDTFDHVCPIPSVSYASSGGSKFEDLLISSLETGSLPM